MERKWKCFVTQEELVGAKVIAIRTSDNVLEEEDWPVHILKFHENGVCAEQIVENKGVYKMDDFAGKNRNDLVEWSNCNSTGSHDETSYDLCILICF